ncbi:MAG: aldolase/citrate lyase family protein [Candidatus Poribacteria bacterium]|nr:aldolase/citrate lyase family protein [Candidatus Poribacteria bacterium]
MRSKQIKSNLRQGEILIGTFVMEFAVPSIATILASAGADFIIIDMEHTTFTMETVGRIVRAARGSDLPSIVRVPVTERHFISRALDAGASGIMIPRVESREDVDNIVKWAKYAPAGDRGVAFGIGHTDYGDFRQLDGVKYTQQANEEIFIVGQIETAKSIENLVEILDSGGLDAIFIGPYDLSTSMGVSGQLDHPLIVESIEKIIAKAKAHQIILGSYVNDFESGKRWLEAGVQLIAFGNDAFLITCKFSEECQKFKASSS